MTTISLIAAVDEAWGIGLENQLLCHLPADLKYFKQVTMGKPIIMGRNTFLSIGRALPGRRNIVLSHKLATLPDVEIAHSVNAALDLLKDADEVFIIGGETIFNQTLPLANKVYITHINHAFAADAHFPKIDESIWRCKETIFREKDESNIYNMTFAVYEK